jgi:phenylalanyl-tRNA synthetase alpha chain
MNEQIKAIQAEIDAYVISNESELESFRNQFVGRKSQLASLFDELKNVLAENRREVGQALNGSV